MNDRNIDTNPRRRAFSVIALISSLIPVPLIVLAIAVYNLPFSTTGGAGESLILFGLILLLAIVSYPVSVVLTIVLAWLSLSKKRGVAPKADKVLVVSALAINVLIALYGVAAFIFSALS